MKKIILTLIIATTFATTGGCTQDSTSFSREYIQAIRNGAKAKVTLSVTDEHGKPMTNAAATVYFDMISKRGNVIKGLTDTNGLFSAEALCADYASIGVRKDGYYDARFKYGNVRSSDPERLKDGCWQPWDPTIPVVLREIRNPIPMYVKLFEGTFGNGDTVGFDCEKGDFIEPHGEGKVADFMIRVDGSGLKYENMTKEISLDSLDPDGGFMILDWYQYSTFKSEYLAPESGYITNLTASSSHDNTKRVEEVMLYKGGDVTRLDSGGEYVIFKSRIKRDADGNVISANYGKIYRAFEFMGREQTKEAWVRFLYYFNPTPNDRNLEFDGKNSLLLEGARFIP